jgi:hypothetical protein
MKNTARASLSSSYRTVRRLIPACAVIALLAICQFTMLVKVSQRYPLLTAKNTSKYFTASSINLEHQVRLSPVEEGQEIHNDIIKTPPSPPVSSSTNDENLSSPELTKSYQTATACLLSLERFVNDRMDYWLDQYVPFLMNSFLIDGTYHLLFSNHHLNKTTLNRIKGAIWYCNGDLNLTAITVQQSRRYLADLIVKCPQTSAAPLTRIFNSEISPTMGNHLVYDVSPYIKCDELARQEYYMATTTTPRTLPLSNKEEGVVKKTIGACTEIQGEDARHLASQWIEYHHMIGVDHIWVYLNE